MRKKIAELQEQVTAIDWWIIKNMRHPDFEKKVREKNVLQQRIEALESQVRNLEQHGKHYRPGFTPNTISIPNNLV